MIKNIKKEMIYVIKLINGIEMNKKYPSTFIIPNKKFIVADYQFKSMKEVLNLFETLLQK